MQYPRRIFCSDDDTFDSLPEDDVDKIFRNLEQVEPPSAVIDSILSSIAKLPLLPGTPPSVSPVSPVPGTLTPPKPTPGTSELEGDDEASPTLLWNELDGLVVRKEQSEPS